MTTWLQDSNLSSSHLAGEGWAAETLGPLPASPPLRLQSLGPGEELPIPGEMSQEALQERQRQDGTETATLIWQWAAITADHSGPRAARCPAPPVPHSLALGQQPVWEQWGRLYPGPHHGGESRGEWDLGRRPKLWLCSLKWVWEEEAKPDRCCRVVITLPTYQAHFDMKSILRFFSFSVWKRLRKLSLLLPVIVILITPTCIIRLWGWP